MKTVTSIVASLLLYGCNPDSAHVPEQEKPPIELSRYGVAVFAGGSYSIDVLSDGEFSLVEENPEIATGWWTNDGKTIRIETHSVGKTGILVTDMVTEKTVSIIVSASYFGGDFRDRELGASGLAKVSTLVETQDAEITKAIETELKAEAEQKLNEYLFDPENNRLIIWLNGTGQGTGRRYVGSYEWAIDSLTLNYNGISERYGFTLGNGEHYIQKDVTDEYKIRYPDAHVIRATVQKTLKNVRPLF